MFDALLHGRALEARALADLRFFGVEGALVPAEEPAQLGEAARVALPQPREQPQPLAHVAGQARVCRVDREQRVGLIDDDRAQMVPLLAPY